MKEDERKPCTPLHPFAKAWLAIAMAWAAGFVDAVSWLVLLHVYTSHMTGNTVSLALDLARYDVRQALHHGWPIVPFIAGLLFSSTTAAITRRRGMHCSFSFALIAELLVLAAFVLLGVHYGIDADPKRIGAPLFYCMLSMPAAAMGLQTVTVTRIAGLRVFTTYLTGSLAKFAEAVSHYVLWFYDRTRGRFRNRIGKVLAVTPRIRYAQHAAITGSLWAGFFLGAFCGALSETRYELITLTGPMAVLTTATIVDIVRPVAAADEPVEKDSAH